MPAGAESARHQPEEDEGDREAEREGVLAGEGGEEVPPVDGEARLEEEGEGRRGETGRPRVAQPCEPPERPRAHRQEEGAEDGHQLEGDVVADERVERDGEHPWQREVKRVERKSVVPTGVPPGQLPVWQQVRLQELRERDVRPGVPAGGGGRGHQERRVQLAERHQRHTHDRDQVGPSRPGAARGQPAQERTRPARLERRKVGRRASRRRDVHGSGHLRRRSARRGRVGRRPRPRPPG